MKVIGPPTPIACAWPSVSVPSVITTEPVKLGFAALSVVLPVPICSMAPAPLSEKVEGGDQTPERLNCSFAPEAIVVSPPIWPLAAPSPTRRVPSLMVVPPV